MTASSEQTFKRHYAAHLKHLRLKGLRPKTIVRIPAETGHRFRSKVDSYSGGNWTVIPVQTGH